MKKVLSILLIVVMMLSILLVPAYAEEQTDTKQFRYYDKFYDKCFREINDRYNNSDMYEYVKFFYNEVYYHYVSESEEPDWVLILCPVDNAPSGLQYGTVVGNRVLYIYGGGCLGFVDGYGVYIRETDSCIALRQSSLDQIIELCPDFVEAIEENEIGRVFGDVDENGKIDVFDATALQRYVAEYDDLSNYIIEINGGSYSEYMGDFDRDGEQTILDATAIQRHIAGLE